MSRKLQHGEYASPFLIIFTDLDGTLLDASSYSWEKASQALQKCKKQNIPVIPVTSKTRAEVVEIMRQLDLKGPFITENGGGIFIPIQAEWKPPSYAELGKNFWKWTLGAPYEKLVKALKEIQEEAGFEVRGFSDMTLQEIAALTGLALEECRLAKQREFDEPFIIIDNNFKNEEKLLSMAKKKGLRISKGGRFYHLHGDTDKGIAVEKLTGWYKEYQGNVLTVGLGDSPNDFPMLKKVDFPVFVNSNIPLSIKQIPRMKITTKQGPEGWNVAVLEILKQIEEEKTDV